MEFTTEIETGFIEVYGVESKINEGAIDVDTIHSKGTVKWATDISFKEYGINGIVHVLQSVSVNVEVEYYAPDDVQQIERKRKEFTVTSYEFELKDEMEMDSDSLYPTNIEIDFASKTITVR